MQKQYKYKTKEKAKRIWTINCREYKSEENEIFKKTWDIKKSIFRSGETEKMKFGQPYDYHSFLSILIFSSQN